MQYREYASPLGTILLQCNDHALTGLWLDRELPGGVNSEEPLLLRTQAWLDAYFRGEKPGTLPPMVLTGTPFQRSVWALLSEIPYGETTTYGALAKEVAKRLGKKKMSAQAVGGAVGRNPISILIPCHRVIGADGSLTGYAGGVEKKAALLKIEGIGNL